MEEKSIVWAGYEWMNGQPWGVAHPDPNHVWYADQDESRLLDDGSLLLDINDIPQYFGGDVNHVKKFGCGCLSTKETFLYGYFHFEYILPVGIHLWPAIWLSGIDSWPPEIDIMEGWSGDGIIVPNQPNYKKFIGFNYIHPGVYYGKDNKGNVMGKGYGSFGTDNVTYQCYQKVGKKKVNTCDLWWHKDRIRAYYNDHKVMDIEDENILKGLRGMMYVCIDNAASDRFTQKNFQHYKRYGSPMIVTKFTYEEIS